jgi:hypothetical protein
MLPASSLTEIISNLAGLNLEPTTTAAVIGAVLAPLLRSAGPDVPVPVMREPRARAKPRQKRKKSRPRVAVQTAEPIDGPRQRAIAALQANPGASLTAIAKLAGVSRSTVVNARAELAAEARKQARKPHENPVLAKQGERRERAQRFLKDALTHGPKRVSDVEEAAEKARIDSHTLEQARGDLGVVTSRSNTGNTLSVQWSLP